MSRLHAFGRFWWDFVVGDDWRVAAVVVAATGATWALTRSGVNAWWLLPAAVPVVLIASVIRAARADRGAVV
jgi:hypothetical protein